MPGQDVYVNVVDYCYITVSGTATLSNLLLLVAPALSTSFVLHPEAATFASAGPHLNAPTDSQYQEYQKGPRRTVLHKMHARSYMGGFAVVAEPLSSMSKCT